MTDQSKDRETDKSGRTKLVIIIAMSFVPIFVAYFVFFNYPGLLPTMTVNNGTLIQSPIQLDSIDVDADRKWRLLLPVAAECDETCQQVLYFSRQIHVGLGKYTPRVKRVLLVQAMPEGALAIFLEQEHGEVEVVNISGSETAMRLNALVPGSDYQRFVFIMDPNGNVMMYYRPDQVGKPLQKDLKHLLKTSNIG